MMHKIPPIFKHCGNKLTLKYHHYAIMHFKQSYQQTYDKTILRAPTQHRTIQYTHAYGIPARSPIVGAKKSIESTTKKYAIQQIYTECVAGLDFGPTNAIENATKRCTKHTSL